MQAVRIHRYSAGPQGALVNAYLVETGEGIVAVDGTLTVSDEPCAPRAGRVAAKAAPGSARDPCLSGSLRRGR